MLLELSWVPLGSFWVPLGLSWLPIGPSQMPLGLAWVPLGSLSLQDRFQNAQSYILMQYSDVLKSGNPQILKFQGAGGRGASLYIYIYYTHVYAFLFVFSKFRCWLPRIARWSILGQVHVYIDISKG